MNAKEMAKSLEELEYGIDSDSRLLADAKNNGLVIVYGASDDLVELRGHIDDEIACYGGGDILIKKEGVIFTPDCDCEYAEKWHEQNKQGAALLQAIWCSSKFNGDIAWSFDISVPHETFLILEGDEVFCIGIVFSSDDLK